MGLLWVKVKLRCLAVKGEGACRDGSGMWVQIYEVEYSFFIASEKPVSHEAYSTSQSSATVRQITSESPLHPGKPSSSNTRM